MNDEWNLTNQLSTAADTVTVLLAGPQSRNDMWLSVISIDTRFRVTTMATAPDDLKTKLSSNPDIILLDASIFGGGESLIEFASRITGSAIYVVLPQVSPQESLQVKSALDEIQAVRAVYQIDVNLASLLEKMYGDARALRSIQGSTATPAWSGGNGNSAQPVSTRIVSVWNQMGGVGKTTIASNLAAESARRGYPTLLIGLGAPDDLPLIMGLKAQPNITHWQANASIEGLKLAVQKVGTLDVIGGFPDVLSEAQAMNLPSDHPGSVRALVDTAIKAGYAVIMIDAPPSSLAAAAIMASNTLVIVGRPALEGVYRTVEAYRTVAERLAGMHNIPANRIYVVLNRVQNGHRLDSGSWHRMASESLGRAFPPVISSIPDLPAVGDAQDSRVLPIHQNDQFADALKPLVDTLFASSNGNRQPVAVKRGKTLKLGPIKVRV